MRCQAIVKRAGTNGACGFELAKRPMHRVKQAEPFDSAIVKVAGIALKGHPAARIHVPQIHWRVTLDDPFSQYPPRATRGLDAD